MRVAHGGLFIVELSLGNSQKLPTENPKQVIRKGTISSQKVIASPSAREFLPSNLPPVARATRGFVN